MRLFECLCPSLDVTQAAIQFLSDFARLQALNSPQSAAVPEKVPVSAVPRSESPSSLLARFSLSQYASFSPPSRS